MTNPALVSPRLDLEPLRASHSELLFDVLSDPSMYQYIAAEPPSSVTTLSERFQQLESRISPDGAEIWLNWAIRIRAIGQYAGIAQATVNRDRTAVLAYQLGIHYPGMGYATEACQLVLDHLRHAHHL